MIDYSKYKEAGKLNEYFHCVHFKDGELEDLFFLLKDIGDDKMRPSSVYRSAYIDESKFDTSNKKIAYLQGVFEIEGNGKNQLSFANAEPKFRRCIRWIHDCSLGFDRKISFKDCIRTEEQYSIPIIRKIILHEEDYSKIVNYNLKG